MARIRFSTKKCFYLPTWEPSASTSASGLGSDDAIASISGEPRVAVQVVSLILPGVRWAGHFSLSEQWYPPGSPLVQHFMLLGSRAVQAPGPIWLV